MIFEPLSKHIDKNNITNRTRYHKTYYVDGVLDYFVNFDMKTIRMFAKEYAGKLTDKEYHDLITHKYNEYRMIALVMLVDQIQDKESLKNSYSIYNKYIKSVNNWNLVDASAHYIVGRFVYETKDYDILYEYINSKDMWVNRIGVVSTLYLIKKNVLEIPLNIIELMLNHPHDLMHKACGWMLREIGKKDINILNVFLRDHYDVMPRTSLRYAIERHEETIRKEILGGQFKWM